MRLFHLRLAQTQFVGYFPRLANLIGAPFASTPIQRLPLGDDVIHRPNDLFHRRIGIGTMTEDQIDIFLVEALKRTVHRLKQILAVERVFLIRAVI